MIDKTHSTNLIPKLTCILQTQAKQLLQRIFLLYKIVPNSKYSTFMLLTIKLQVLNILSLPQIVDSNIYASVH